MAGDDYTHACPVCKEQRPCSGMRWDAKSNAYIHYINCTAVCAEEQKKPTRCEKGTGLGFLVVLSG